MKSSVPGWLRAPGDCLTVELETDLQIGCRERLTRW